MSAQTTEINFAEQVKELAKNAVVFYDSIRNEKYFIDSVSDTGFKTICGKQFPYAFVTDKDKLFSLSELKYSPKEYVFLNEDGNYVRKKPDGTYVIDRAAYLIYPQVVVKKHAIAETFAQFPAQFYDMAGNPVSSRIKEFVTA